MMEPCSEFGLDIPTCIKVHNVYSNVNILAVFILKKVFKVEIE